MRLALPLLAGCVVACHSLSFRVAPTFTPAERNQIQNAAVDWNAVTKDRRITFDERGDWRVLEADTGTGYNGLCNPAERAITINPDPYGTTTYVVALHEFGHALGLRHLCALAQKESAAHAIALCVEGQPSLGVMDPSHATARFTALDMAECRRAGACK